MEVRRARAFCGELAYDSDDSRLGDELDDSAIILKVVTPETASASSDGLTDGLPIERIPITVSKPKARMTNGKRDKKIDKIRRLSGSAFEKECPEDDSEEQQVNITGTHEHNQIALDMISSMRRAEIRRKSNECRPATISMAGSEALGDRHTVTGPVDTLSAPLQVPERTNKSKKRKAEHAEPVPSFSTTAALKVDRRQNTAKRSKAEASLLNEVAENPPDGQNERLSTANVPQIKDSHIKKSLKNTSKQAFADHGQSPMSDSTTATQEVRTKKEKRKKKTKEPEAQQVDDPPNLKKPRRVKTTELISSIGDKPLVVDSDVRAVEIPVALTPSEEAHSAAIRSDGNIPAKHRKNRKTKKECSKEQSPRKDIPAKEAPAVELSETHIEASKLTKRKKKTKLHRESETSVKTPVEEPKEKSSKSKKRKDNPSFLQEQQEVNEKPDEESNAPPKSTGKSTRHRQATIPPATVLTDGGETEEKIRSEYFTPTKPKSDELLSNAAQDSGVKKQEISPTKARSNLKIGMEDKRRSFLAELRRRSSLGPTTAASLEDTVDTTVPMAESDIFAHIVEAGNEDQSRRETEKTRSIKQVVKPKKQYPKKRDPIGFVESSGTIENARPESPATSQPAQVVEQDQQRPVVNSVTKSLAKVSKKKKKRKEKNSAAADTTGTTLTCETNENQSSAIPMSGGAASVDLDLALPIIPLLYSGWNPVNQATPAADNLADSSRSQPPYVAVESETSGAHNYVDDPVELDQENWAVTSDHEASLNNGPGKASRKRKKTTNVEKHGRNSSGIMTSTKKPRLMKVEAGSSVDFSSPMIR